MKKIITKIKTTIVFVALTGGFLLGGCQKYLDQAPEAAVNAADAFKNFASFQGFVEGCQNQVVDVSRNTDFGDADLADETRRTFPSCLGVNFDNGDYWGWQSAYGSYFGRTNTTQDKMTDPLSPATKSIWYGGWYGIRRANLGLANLDKLVDATQEEKDLIKGQLLFWRAYFYFTLIREWGGFPYLDKALEPTEEMKYPRLNYLQTATKADADFAEAAKLLPLNWDNIASGKKTLGNNRQRLNKIMALAFQAKNLLYAASPLMNKESTGNATYNVELCKKAADVFAQVINTCDQTGVYTLQPWATYSDIFYRVSPSRYLPGGTEVIFNSPMYSVDTDGRKKNAWGPSAYGFIAQTISVCANYVKYWGMKNGLPIDDPASGFNPADPWSNRDPRFYKTIVVDGDKMANSTAAGADQFAQFYNGGRHRTTATCITGFYSNKYWGLTCNKFDLGWSNNQLQWQVPILRLADVYLMYAEAVLQGYGTPQSSAPGCITALDAVNKIRQRATVPGLDPKFTASKDAFMEQLVVERAVELSFENLRWNDLRRWLKNGDPRYMDKTELLFDRNPVTQKPINIKERLIIQRAVSEKHNWLPLPLNQVTLYKEYKQNPGW